MKRCIYFITLILIFFSCSFEPKNNKELREKIDSMGNLKTIYIVELDSKQRYKDTLFVEKYKKNKKGKKVYTEKVSYRGKDTIIIASYFNNEGELFFEKSIHSLLGLVSTYEYWNQKGETERAISVAFEDNKVQDTIFIEYDKSQMVTKKKTTINSKYEGEIGNQTELFYNQDNLLESEVFIMKNDTLSLTNYKYSEGQLIEKTINDYKDSILSIIKYDNEKRKEEYLYAITDSTKNKLRFSEYHYNKKGDIDKTVITSYPLNKKTVLMYLPSSSKSKRALR